MKKICVNKCDMFLDKKIIEILEQIIEYTGGVRNMPNIYGIWLSRKLKQSVLTD